MPNFNRGRLQSWLSNHAYTTKIIEAKCTRKVLLLKVNHFQAVEVVRVGSVNFGALGASVVPKTLSVSSGSTVGL